MLVIRNLSVVILLSALLCCSGPHAGAGATAESMRVVTEQNDLSIYVKDSPVLRYRFDDVQFKPYVREFFSPNGVNVLRDSPLDHLHHHALMFAIAVDGVNFWEENKEPGRELHRAFTNTWGAGEAGMARAGFNAGLEWIKPDTQAVLVEEQRTVEVVRAEDIAASLLTWTSRFTLPPGKTSATFTGAHYHGLGMRFLKSMDGAGTFSNADGADGAVFRGTERLTASAWCAYRAEADGQPVTVAMFGHPDNVRHPVTWFTMAEPFAYMSATLNSQKEPLTITSPLMLRYGVALWDGHVNDDQIKRLYERWVALPASGKADSAAQ